MKKFLVPPPLFTLGIFPCSQCHKDMPVNRKPRTLEMMHQEIKLRHMPGGWCFDCHNPDNRDKLRLANGTLIPFEESYNLCGQCHGTILREWKRGLHGNRTGYWVRGDRRYYLWMGFLSFLILTGLVAYLNQLNRGLIATAMRDQVSWGFYISNFTFLVGVAAAVLLDVPAYIYNFRPIKEIVFFGELLAITAITMCIFFIMVDLGQPLRVWHILPVIGMMNFPSSLLAWDVIALNGYLFLNGAIVFYTLYRLSKGREYK